MSEARISGVDFTIVVSVLSTFSTIGAETSDGESCNKNISRFPGCNAFHVSCHELLLFSRCGGFRGLVVVLKQGQNSEMGRRRRRLRDRRDGACQRAGYRHSMIDG